MKGTLVSGVLADRAVRVVDVAWHGSSAITLTYTDEETGKVYHELLYRDDEPRLAVVAGRAWPMDADVLLDPDIHDPVGAESVIHGLRPAL